MKRRKIEGFWDCDKCDRKRIRARYDSCPGCGNRKNSNTKYYMADKKNYVSEDVADTIDNNPDWLCSHCGNLNRANWSNCLTCGAPLSTSESNYFQNRKKVEEKERQIEELENNNDNNLSSDELQIESNSMDDKNEITIKTGSIPQKILEKFISFVSKISFSYILGTIGVILSIMLLIFLFMPKEEVLDITDFSWKTSISIEEYKTVKENDWYLPTGARLLYTNKEISDYEKVFDHYETKTKNVPKKVLVGYDEEISYKDIGNGYFEEIVEKVPIYEMVYEKVEYQEAVYRYEPIYKTKYYYEIDKWVHKETKTQNGNGKKTCYPDVTLGIKERESGRRQSYFVTGINEDGESLTLSISYDEWMKLSIGQRVKFEVNLGNTANIIEIME